MKGIDFSLLRPRSPRGHIVNGRCTASRKGGADPSRGSATARARALPSLYSKRRSRDRKDRPSKFSLKASSGRTSAATSRTSRLPISTRSRYADAACPAVRGLDLGDEAVRRQLMRKHSTRVHRSVPSRNYAKFTRWRAIIPAITPKIYLSYQGIPATI